MKKEIALLSIYSLILFTLLNTTGRIKFWNTNVLTWASTPLLIFVWAFILYLPFRAFTTEPNVFHRTIKFVVVLLIAEFVIGLVVPSTDLMLGLLIEFVFVTTFACIIQIMGGKKKWSTQ